MSDYSEWRKAAAARSGRLLWHFGIRESNELWRNHTSWITPNLRKRGRFWPATLIDVGVGFGTHGLYEAFPESHLVLIEPLEEFKPNLDRLADEHGGEYLLTAVGAREGSVTIQVAHHALEGSSILHDALELPTPEEPPEEREVPIARLDTLAELRGWQPPFGLKIDTEGFEDEVIRGATGLLEETQFVIAEVTVKERYEGSYTFAEFIALMDSLGFSLCDILDGLKAMYLETVFIDAMFERRR